jgi:hypothetical protein
VRKALKAGAACGAAPGPDGWTGELLTPLLHEPDCLSGITALINLITSNQLPPAIRTQLCAARGLPLIKPGGGIRPIWMGNALLKLAAACAIQKVKPHFGSLFPSIQLGVGVRGGSESAVHAVQTALESSSDSVVLKLDITNAFNQRKRSEIAAALHSNPLTKPLWHLFHAVYGHCNAGLLYEPNGKLAARIDLAEGVMQGDVLGSFAFALSMQPLYEQAVRGAGLISAVAVQDDFTVVGTVVSVRTAFAAFSRLCTQHGIALNLGKCKVLWPHDAPVPEQVTGFAHDQGMQLITGSMELLGAQIGCTHDGISDAISTQAQSEHRTFFELLPHLSSQVALLLLRACGIPRLNYLSRTHTPADFQRAATAFDTSVAEQLQRIINGGGPDARAIGLPQKVLTQLSLPIRRSGAGFRSYVATSPAAFLASALQAMHLAPDTLHPDSPWATAVQQAMASIRSRSDRSLSASTLPANFVEAWGQYHPLSAEAVPHNLQRQFTRLTEQHSEQLLVTSEEDRARLLALKQPYAMLWLNVVPEHAQHRLSDFQVMTQLRIITGLPPAHTAVTCKCGAPLSHTHALTCLSTRKLCTESRHDCVLDAVCKVSAELGVPVQREYRAWVGGKKQPRHRPDLLFDGASMSLLSDVAITTPTAPSLLLKGTATTSLLAATLRENDKRAKYAHIARERDLTLTPFVLESYGGWGKGARTVLRKLVSAGIGFSGGGVLTEADAITHARRTVAVALVQGNARLVATALRLARNRSAHRSSAASHSRPLHVVRRARSSAADPPADSAPIQVVHLQQLPRASSSVEAVRRYGGRQWL